MTFLAFCDIRVNVKIIANSGTTINRKKNKMTRQTIFKQINNVQLKWAFLDKVNDKGQYPSYKYEVVVSMDYDQKEALMALPHSPKQNVKEVDGRYEFRFKAKPKDGHNPIKILDRNQIVLPQEQVAKIGNGTIATIRVYSYNTKFGDFIGLDAIKVNELKEYVSGGIGGFEDDGYSAVADSVSDSDAPF